MECCNYWSDRNATTTISESTVSTGIPIVRWQRSTDKSRPWKCKRRGISSFQQTAKHIFSFSRRPASTDRCIAMDTTTSATAATTTEFTGKPTGPGPPIATTITCRYAIVRARRSKSVSKEFLINFLCIF